MAIPPNTVITHELDSATTLDVVVDLARRDAERTPQPYNLTDDTGDRSLVLVKLRADEHVHTIDLEQHLTAPGRARGQAAVHDPSDFADYVNRLANPTNTTVWANEKAGTLTAIVNDHADWDDPGWRDHTITLHLQDDADWLQWHRRDGQRTSQEDFAEFVEDVAHTIIDPDAATMLEVATTLSAKRQVDFNQGVRLQTGDVQLKFEETTTAAAGAKGNLEVPERIRVRIAPWLGVEPVELDARLRWRIQNKQLAIGYQLLRSDIAKREAFAQLVDSVRESLEATLPVFLGTPPPSLRTR